MKKLTSLAFALLAFSATNAYCLGLIKVGSWDNNVAKVNEYKLSKYDVEERMGETVVRLREYKKTRTQDGKWDAATEAEWTRLYAESFRTAVRTLIRERLMIQQFDREKMSLTGVAELDLQISQKEPLKLAAFREHLKESKNSEDDWFRAAYTKALVVQFVEGSARPLPLIFFFPNDPNYADELAREVKKANEARATEKNVPPASPPPEPAPTRVPCVPCLPCPCPPPPCPLNSRR